MDLWNQHPPRSSEVCAYARALLQPEVHLSGEREVFMTVRLHWLDHEGNEDSALVSGATEEETRERCISELKRRGVDPDCMWSSWTKVVSDVLTMKKFRKKPVVIEAIQFTGHNDAECLAFCPVARDPEDVKANLVIPTLEGEMLVSPRDYIIKGVRGEFYPCKPEIFAATYEPVGADDDWWHTNQIENVEDEEDSEATRYKTMPIHEVEAELHEAGFPDDFSKRLDTFIDLVLAHMRYNPENIAKCETCPMVPVNRWRYVCKKCYCMKDSERTPISR